MLTYTSIQYVMLRTATVFHKSFSTSYLSALIRAALPSSPITSWPFYSWSFHTHSSLSHTTRYLNSHVCSSSSFLASLWSQPHPLSYLLAFYFSVLNLISTSLAYPLTIHLLTFEVPQLTHSFPRPPHTTVSRSYQLSLMYSFFSSLLQFPRCTNYKQRW